MNIFNLIFIGDRLAVEYASLSNSECISSKTSHDLHLDNAILNDYINPIFIYSMGTGDYEILSKSRYHGFWDRIYYDIKKLKKYGRTVYLIPCLESLINTDRDTDKEDYQRIGSIYTSIENCIDRHEIEYIDLRDDPSISIEEIVKILET